MIEEEHNELMINYI